MSTRKKKRPRKSRPPRDDDDNQSPEDTTKSGGFILALLGAVFGYALVTSPWDYINAIPKVIGLIFCLFVVFGGILLLLPEQDRPAMTDALVKGFTLTLKAIVSMGKEMARQISSWRATRRERKEQEEEDESLASEQ
jgi:hypothetical protein